MSVKDAQHLKGPGSNYRNTVPALHALVEILSMLLKLLGERDSDEHLLEFGKI